MRFGFKAIFNHSPYSLIVDLTQTMVVGHQAKVFALSI